MVVRPPGSTQPPIGATDLGHNQTIVCQPQDLFPGERHDLPFPDHHAQPGTGDRLVRHGLGDEVDSGPDRRPTVSFTSDRQTSGQHAFRRPPFLSNAQSAPGGTAAMWAGERDSPNYRPILQEKVYRTVHVATNPEGGRSVGGTRRRNGRPPAAQVGALGSGGSAAPAVACRNRSTTRALRGPCDCTRNRRL